MPVHYVPFPFVFVCLLWFIFLFYFVSLFFMFYFLFLLFLLLDDKILSYFLSSHHIFPFSKRKKLFYAFSCTSFVTQLVLFAKSSY